jgi:hypothetical protein
MTTKGSAIETPGNTLENPEETERVALEGVFTLNDAKGTRVTIDFYWGVCPLCWAEGEVGEPIACKSVGPDHWYYCDRHKARWYVGSNLFSYWRDMTEEEHRRNEEYLRNCIEVEPIMVKVGARHAQGGQ